MLMTYPKSSVREKEKRWRVTYVDGTVSSYGISFEDDDGSFSVGRRALEELVLVFARVGTNDDCPPNVSLSEQTVGDDIDEEGSVCVDAGC